MQFYVALTKCGRDYNPRWCLQFAFIPKPTFHCRTILATTSRRKLHYRNTNTGCIGTTACTCTGVWKCRQNTYANVQTNTNTHEKKHAHTYACVVRAFVMLKKRNVIEIQSKSIYHHQRLAFGVGTENTHNTHKKSRTHAYSRRWVSWRTGSAVVNKSYICSGL